MWCTTTASLPCMGRGRGRETGGGGPQWYKCAHALYLCTYNTSTERVRIHGNEGHSAWPCKFALPYGARAVSVLFIVQTPPSPPMNYRSPWLVCTHTPHRPSLTLDIATLMCTKCLLAELLSPVHWLCRETEFLALSSCWVGLPACYTNWHVNTQYPWHPIPRSILYTQEKV